MTTNPQSLEALLALANLAAETSDNMNEAVKGGGGGKLLPTGYCLAHLVEYVEFGQQPQEFNGVAKDPALEYQLGFALYGPGYQNDDGTPYLFRTYPRGMSRNEKAGAFLEFKALNWKGTATSFPQLLGQAFMLCIENKPPKDSTKKAKSTIDLKKTLPPMDQLTKQPYPMPPVPADLLCMFLWNHPSLETFTGFYKEGKYDDGNSKNSVQEKMLGALDFHGSALHQLLLEKQVPFTIPPKKAAPAAPAQPAAIAPAAPAIAPAAPVIQPAAPVVAAAAPPFEGGTPAIAPVAVATPAAAVPVSVAPAPVAVAPAPVAAPTPVATPAPAAPAIAMPVMP
jgi:hypothetical protein